MPKEILFLVNLISYNALKKITIKISQLLLYIFFGRFEVFCVKHYFF